MDDYAGRVLADRYRLPLPPSDEYELAETRAFDTYSGQEVLVRQVPLPEVVEAEVLDADGLPEGFVARDGGVRRPSARTTRRPTEPAVRRAIEAAQAAAQIPDHPRLDQVFDVFAEGGSLWIVSELVPARPLAALLTEKPLSPYRAAEVASDVLTALRVLHAHGWVHRNITVRTVLVCDDGRVMLTGLAAGAAEEALCGYDPVPAREDVGTERGGAVGAGSGGGTGQAGQGGSPGVGGSVPRGNGPGGPSGAGARGPSGTGFGGGGAHGVAVAATAPGADPEAARRAAIEARAERGTPDPGTPAGGAAGVGRRALEPGGTDGSGGTAGAGGDIRAARAGAIAAYRAGARAAARVQEEQRSNQVALPAPRPSTPAEHAADASAPAARAPGHDGSPLLPGQDGSPQVSGHGGVPQVTGYSGPPQLPGASAPAGRAPGHGGSPLLPGQDGSPQVSGHGGVPQVTGYSGPPQLPGASAPAGRAPGHGGSPLLPGQDGSPQVSGHGGVPQVTGYSGPPQLPGASAPAGRAPGHDGSPLLPGQDGSPQVSGHGGVPQVTGYSGPPQLPGHGVEQRPHTAPPGQIADPYGVGGDTSWHGAQPRTGAPGSDHGQGRAALPGGVNGASAGGNGIPALESGQQPAGGRGGPGAPAAVGGPDNAPGQAGRWDELVAGAPPRRGPSTALAAERARHARMAVVGPVTERWAPEQAHPVQENWQLAAPIGPATDLWALGALLFRAVQGHAPYPEENTAELVQLVCAEPPAFAEECGPLRPVVESLLRQDPTERLEFEELRGWLRSLVRSAPEPEAGAHVVAAPPVDPSRLPIVRRRGELVRRRRAGLPATSPHARHKRAKQEKPAKPRRLGRNLVLLVLLLLAAAITYAMVFMPKAESSSGRGSGTDGDRTGAAGDVGPAPDTGGDSKASSEPRPDQTSPAEDKSPSGSSSSTTSQSGDPDVAQGFKLRKDSEGFRVAVADGWDRTPKNGSGQVVYSHGDFELIVVPGRDSAATYGSDPMTYQRENEKELQPFRDSTWATSSGMRRIDVGGRTMAEGQFTWQDSAGRSLYVRNLAILAGGRYHVVQLRGPEAERDEVTRLYEQASATYQVTG
ncbi:protein kinase [Streptomyces sp. NBC_00996]|uniref:protein kinase n=1 Tax=Streptomyces sp. NBC_00996 TaxID=2903710 RepID=UPI00386911E6|nr:protein kinase [Streptomyces sp. NBC_00996]